MKSRVILFLLIGAVAASGAFLLFRSRETDRPVARITRDGVLLEEIDLDQVREPYTLTFEDESGSNAVCVEKGRIRISEADCPDQVCVHRGWADRRSAAPIVCLPHKLMIEIVGGELDGGAG